MPMGARRRRRNGFWREERQQSLLLRFIGREITAAEAARMIGGCTPVMIRKAASELRQNLKIGFAVRGRLVPGLILALIGLSGEANRLMDRIEADRKRKEVVGYGR